MARTSPIRLRTVAATIVVVASGLIIFNVYQSIINSSDETMKTVPVIKADSEPFRIVPEDAGGAQIPGKDSTIFRMLDNDDNDPLALAGAEITSEDEPSTIMPPSEVEAEDSRTGFSLPERPEPQTESLYGDIEDLKQRDTKPEGQDVVPTPETQADPVPLAEGEKAELKEQLSEIIENTDSEPTEDADENISVSMQEPPVPSFKPSAPIVKTNTVKEKIESGEIKSYYIQLASLRDEVAARNTYERIRNNFPDLVRGLSVSFPKADLGARGVFTRIQVGPLSQNEAQKRCNDYTNAPRGGTCLVLSR